MINYKCLNVQEFHRGKYTLIPIRKEDIFLIKEWRNQQIKILRQKSELTDDDQLRYYDKVIVELFEQAAPTQLLFSYLCDNTLIGYGGLVHISWIDKRAEVSFLLNTERTKNAEIYTRDFLHFLSLIKELAFIELGFNRIFTETYNVRDLHVSILEQSGFVPEGILRQHIILDGIPVDSLIHGF